MSEIYLPSLKIASGTPQSNYIKSLPMTERKQKMNIQQLDSPYKSAKALQTIRYSSVNNYNKKQL